MGRERSDNFLIVIAGLDPAIHLREKLFCEV
jgi:hypothetical protein